MISFPLETHARVELIDGYHAYLDSVVIDPAEQAVRELVIIDTGNNRRAVPIHSVSSAEGGSVRLKMSGEELLALPLFDETQYTAQPDVEMDFINVGETDPHTVYFLRQSEGAEGVKLAEDLQLIRGAFVAAKDGTIGSVEAIEIDPNSGKLSQLVIVTRKSEELVLPVALIERVEADTVYLRMTQDEIASLPATKIQAGKRRYDLIARVFEDPTLADIAIKDWKGVYSKQARRWLASTAVIIRDAEGKITINETGDMDARHGRILGAVGGGLVGLLGGPVGVVVGALAGAGVGGIAANKVDTGISDKFLQTFAEELKPNSSAIVMLVDHEGVPEINKAISNLSGVLVQEELTDQMIQKFLARKEG